MNDAAAPTAASNCANCEAPLQPAQHYCGQCGQKSPTHRLTTAELGHELTHAFFHVDRSFLALLRELAVRPGRVAREFVDGRRKRYFGPFAFLVIVVGVASVLMAWSGFLNYARSGDDDQARAVTDFVQSHVNLMMLIQVPFLTLFCALLFRKDRLNLAEHLVLVCYASGMRSVFFTAFALPIWLALQSKDAVYPFLVAYLLAWAGYFGFAASQFYTGRRLWIVAKAAAAALLTQLTTSTLVVIVTLAYIYIRRH